jgi:hypothetical protein
MMRELRVQVGEPGPDALLVCTRADDFDPATNVLWELDGNRSAVRDDVHCFSCQSALAMSNDLYGKYTRADAKPRACCAQCMLTLARAGEL